MRKGAKSWTKDYIGKNNVHIHRHRFGREDEHRDELQILEEIGSSDAFWGKPIRNTYPFTTTRNTPSKEQNARERQRAEEMAKKRAEDDRRRHEHESSRERAYWEGDARSRNQLYRYTREDHERARERHRSNPGERAREERPRWGWGSRSRSRDRGRESRQGESSDRRSRSRDSGRDDRRRERANNAGNTEEKTRRDATTQGYRASSSPPRQRSRLNDYHDDEPRTSTLVAALDLPTTEDLVCPGQAGWSKAIKFLQSCLAQHARKRISDWPPNLITSITTQWMHNAPIDYSCVTETYSRNSWKDLSTRELFLYMHSLLK